MSDDLRKNGAGYRDDTAFRAISNIIREERKARKHDNRHSETYRNNHDNNSDRAMDPRSSERPSDARKLGR